MAKTQSHRYRLPAVIFGIAGAFFFVQADAQASPAKSPLPPLPPEVSTYAGCYGAIGSIHTSQDQERNGNYNYSTSDAGQFIVQDRIDANTSRFYVFEGNRIYYFDFDLRFRDATVDGNAFLRFTVPNESWQPSNTYYLQLYPEPGLRPGMLLLSIDFGGRTSGGYRNSPMAFKEVSLQGPLAWSSVQPSLNKGLRDRVSTVFDKLAGNANRGIRAEYERRLEKCAKVPDQEFQSILVAQYKALPALDPQPSAPASTGQAPASAGPAPASTGAAAGD